jgi:hypothetical protein
VTADTAARVARNRKSFMLDVATEVQNGGENGVGEVRFWTSVVGDRVSEQRELARLLLSES